MASNTINSGLPMTPAHPDPVTAEELRFVYDAVSLNQQILSDAVRFIAKSYEAISAGDYVSVILDGGVCKVRKANAANNTKVAVAFSSTNVPIDTWGVYTSCGNNHFKTGLTVSSYYYLSDSVSGGVTATKPVGVGKIVQPLGFALSSTELITNISLQFTQL